MKLLCAIATGAFVGSAAAQYTARPGDQTPQVQVNESGGFVGRLLRPYRPRAVSPLPLSESDRIQSLLRAGNLYLSVSDAIALALENNLDVQFQRYGLPEARSDLLRAEGGGALRGVGLTVNEAPPGLGGPGSPLLTTAATGTTAPTTSSAIDLTQVTSAIGGITNLSIGTQGNLSLGPPIPAFDPFILSNVSWGRTEMPTTNPFITGAISLMTRTTVANVSFNQGYSPGTQLIGSLDTTNQSTNSIRTVFNPFTTSTGGFVITQPLLRGFGVNMNRRFIRIAKNNERVSDLVFRQQLISTVSGIIRLYYDLVALVEDVGVKRQSLALAQKLYEDNRAQVLAGTLAPIEVVRAQAQIAASQLDLINSQALVREQELVIKNVITRLGTADERIRNARIIPTDTVIIPEQDQVVPIQDLIGLAMRDRPDLGAARLQLENSSISLEGSRNALLPQIDFVATIQSNGLAGMLSPNAAAQIIPGTVTPAITNIGGFGTVLSQIFQKSFPSYTIGLNINLPLRNRVAQADYVRDQLQVRQGEVRALQFENQARLEVEDALVALDRSRGLYEAARQARMLQEQSLQIEQERFAAGLSTTFLIIQYQTFVAQARSTEVVARADWVKARTALDRATGQTLRVNNITVAEAYRGRISTPPSPLPVLPSSGP